MPPPPASRVIVTDSFDWTNTGRGKHVEFGKDEQLPLEIGPRLGRGSTSDVNETMCRGLAIAVKRRYLARIIPDSAPFKKEMNNLERVTGHDHIVKIIGSFVHNRVIGILLWPVAICDLGVFLDDWDMLESKSYSFSLPSNGIVRRIGQEGFMRLEALNAINVKTDASGFTDPLNSDYELDRGYRRISEAFGCLSAALAYIHGQKVKHKDLKPSNILLTRDNIYITDFGTSSAFAGNMASETETGVRGTPSYFAPEVANYLPCGRSADVFSLGCIFMEMLCIICFIPLRELEDSRSNRNHSYHANLEQILLWARSHVWPDYSPIELIVNEMLRVDPKWRPSALDVFKTIRVVKRVGGYPDSVMCGGCCEDLTIFA